MPQDPGQPRQDAAFTGRRSLGSPTDIWADLVRTYRREARRCLTGFEVTIAILVAVGFLTLALRVADGSATGTHPATPLPSPTYTVLPGASPAPPH